MAHVASAEATGGFPLEPGVYRSSPGISVYEGFTFFFFGSVLKEWKEFSHNTDEMLLWSPRGPEAPLEACWQVV